MDPAKVSAVTDWPRPDSQKQLQGFLGFANFYRRFIWNYSSVAAPLTTFISTLWALRWSPEAEAAFSSLKGRFTSAPILTMPDLDQQFMVEVDASNIRIGGLVSKGPWRPEVAPLCLLLPADSS